MLFWWDSPTCFWQMMVFVAIVKHCKKVHIHNRQAPFGVCEAREERIIQMEVLFLQVAGELDNVENQQKSRLVCPAVI